MEVALPGGLREVEVEGAWKAGGLDEGTSLELAVEDELEVKADIESGGSSSASKADGGSEILGMMSGGGGGGKVRSP